MKLIYKLAPKTLWDEMEAKGVFTGAPIDVADGYIHFSTAETVVETADKWFANETDVLLIAIDEAKLDASALKYEVSRGGALFPHLYADLNLDSVVWVKPLPQKPDNSFDFDGLLEG